MKKALFATLLLAIVALAGASSGVNDKAPPGLSFNQTEYNVNSVLEISAEEAVLVAVNQNVEITEISAGVITRAYPKLREVAGYKQRSKRRWSEETLLKLSTAERMHSTGLYQPPKLC